MVSGRLAPAIERGEQTSLLGCGGRHIDAPAGRPPAGQSQVVLGLHQRHAGVVDNAGDVHSGHGRRQGIVARLPPLERIKEVSQVRMGPVCYSGTKSSKAATSMM